MIIEIYILLQVFIIILFLIGWFKGQPMFWVLEMLFSGILIFSSYNIQYIYSGVINQTILKSQIVSYSYPVLSYINFIFFGVALLMFFWDIFRAKDNSLTR